MLLKTQLKFKLKPCPFCGYKGADVVPHKHISSLTGIPSVDYWIVGCDGCGAEIKDFYGEKEAVKAWNKRIK